MAMNEAVITENMRKDVAQSVSEILRGCCITHEAPCGQGRIDISVRWRNLTIGVELKHSVDRKGVARQLEGYSTNVDLLIVVCSLRAESVLRRLVGLSGHLVSWLSIDRAFLALRDGAFPNIDRAEHDAEERARHEARRMSPARLLEYYVRSRTIELRALADPAARDGAASSGGRSTAPGGESIPPGGFSN